MFVLGILGVSIVQISEGMLSGFCIDVLTM